MPNDKQLQSLTGLRGIAALAVVVFHLTFALFDAVTEGNQAGATFTSTGTGTAWQQTAPLGPTTNSSATLPASR